MNDEKNKSENNDLNLEKNYYAFEYPGQEIDRKDSFKKWYSFQSEKIKTQN